MDTARGRTLEWLKNSFKPSGTSPPSSLPFVVMSVQEEMTSSGDCVDTTRGQMLERLKNSFK